MRIRLRVTAPVERLRYARRASRSHIRTGAQPEIFEIVEPAKTKIGPRNGVVHRMCGGVISEAPAHPVNNAGQAIQVSKPAVSPVSKPASRTMTDMLTYSVH